MQSEIMFAGFGGQGILLMGEILALAALKSGKEVAWIPSYGPEMRGGTAYCTVVISDRPIGSPVIKHPQHLVAMNRPSLEKFASVVKADGVVLINSSLIPIESGRDDVDQIKITATGTAREMGNVRVANILALSAFVARSKIIEFEMLQEAVKQKLAKKAKLIPINLDAMEKGKEQALAQ